MYGTVVAGQQHWDQRGYVGVLTSQLLSQGSIFVDSIGWRVTHTGAPVSRFPGVPTVPSQVMQWPRTGARNLYGVDLDPNFVPLAVERATYEAAWYELNNPGQLGLGQRTDQKLAREQYGDVAFSYFHTSRPTVGSGMTQTGVYLPWVMAELAPLLVDGGNPYGITGVVA